MIPDTVFIYQPVELGFQLIPVCLANTLDMTHRMVFNVSLDYFLSIQKYLSGKALLKHVRSMTEI